MVTSPDAGPEPAVAALARRQHGLFTTAQALGTGLTRTQIQDRLQAGRWTAVEPGLYLIAGCPFTWHTRVMGACLVTGGVASHRTAAVLHGVAGMRPGRPEITIERRRRVHRDTAIIHQSTDLRATDVVVLSGISTTTPARLAMDLGASVPFETYERAIDDLVARRRLSWDEMLDALCRLSRRGRNGLGPARALLLSRYGDEVPDSVLERAFLQIVRGAGLPEPVGQYELADAEGFIARVDFAYPDRRVAIELDSRRYHLHARAFEFDRWKRNRLQVTGWQVLSYTWEQVVSKGPSIVSQLRAALTPN